MQVWKQALRPPSMVTTVVTVPLVNMAPLVPIARLALWCGAPRAKMLNSRARPVPSGFVSLVVTRALVECSVVRTNDKPQSMVMSITTEAGQALASIAAACCIRPSLLE